MKSKYEVLFTPSKIGSCEVKNRFVMCPMEPTSMIEWTMSAKGYHDEVHDLLIDRAKDGVGLIIPGAMALRSFKNGEWLYNHPEAFNGIKEVMDEIHSYGSKVFFQLSAGMGRNFPIMKDLYSQYDKLNEVMGLDYLNSSADADMPNRWIKDFKTKQLSVEDIHDLVNAMAETAYLCKQNGVDGIDVHAVHEGYLLDQFTLPYTNHRTDEYGGSLENRLRFACEIVQAIKKKCGDDYPVILRYSVTSKVRDFGKGIIPQDTSSLEIGRSFEESKKAIKILSDAGYDAFNADNGTYDSWYYAHPPLYMPLNCNIEESIKVKPYTEKPIICAGRMQLDESAKAIENGELDFVGIGRQFLTDEKYLTKIREDKEEDIRPCISCHLGCMPIGLWKDSGCVVGNMGGCALNPLAGNEKKYKIIKSKNPKNIAVIGGGITGMEFALQAVERGHSVDLYEKSNVLGGVFIQASKFSFKEKDRELIEYYRHQINKSNVNVHLNTEIKDLKSLNYDEIVVATGSATTRTLNVPGCERSMTAIDFLREDMPCGDEVAIIGGGLTGCEIAYELALQGKKPSIIELQDDILKVPGSSMANTSFLRDAFDYYNVPIYRSAKTLSINEDSVTIETSSGEKKDIPTSQTVISVGYTSGTPFGEISDEHIHVLGDADHVANLYVAITKANDLVITL